MSRKFGNTSLAPKQRCLRRGCDRWEFEKGLCKQCAAAGGPVTELSKVDWEAFKNKPPIQTGFVVVQVVDEPHFLELVEGDIVDVLEWRRDNNTAIVRSSREEVGFYAASVLKTEEEIYNEFRLDEDVRICQYLENQEEIERQQEQEYDRLLKERMRAKAEEDRRQREEDAIRRRAEAERLLQEIEERKAWEASQEQERREAIRRQREEREKMEAQQRVALREEAARERQVSDRKFMSRLQQKEAERKAWEEAEAARKDKEYSFIHSSYISLLCISCNYSDKRYLDSLPAWKREVVLRKRAQQQNG
eukprot:m.48070 g.48070  ORF g.48070 m.48070 type:complete len:306 (-) comp10550_c0_seq1:1226-2143(-)